MKTLKVITAFVGLALVSSVSYYLGATSLQRWSRLERLGGRVLKLPDHQLHVAFHTNGVISQIYVTSELCTPTHLGNFQYYTDGVTKSITQVTPSNSIFTVFYPSGQIRFTKESEAHSGVRRDVRFYETGMTSWVHSVDASGEEIDVSYGPDGTVLGADETPSAESEVGMP